MRHLKLTVQYDGTDYVGWQRQAVGTSIQGLLEDALAPIEGGTVTVHGAGRTDAGVHALGQVASVQLTAALPPATLVRALNAVFPQDVRVISAEEVGPDFHARFSATGKRYRYRLLFGGPGSPFDRRYVWHAPQSLDPDRMRAAAAALVGTHDFAAFAGAGSVVSSTVRRLVRVDLTVRPPRWNAPGTLVEIDLEGDGFLRHMVRNIVGTLVEVGSGRWPESAIPGILASRDRAQAGPTAPPWGLFLVEVLYSPRLEPSV